MNKAVALSSTSHKERREDFAPATRLALFKPYTPSPVFFKPFPDQQPDITTNSVASQFKLVISSAVK